MRVYLRPIEAWPELRLSGVTNDIDPERVELPSELVARYWAARREWKSMKAAVAEHLAATGQPVPSFLGETWR